MIFVDTSGWFASVVPEDKDHFAAVEWFENNRHTLLTSDFVIDETLTLLRARGQSPMALLLGRKFFSGDFAKIHYLTENEVAETWLTFERYADKEWSFTDCSSKLLMARYKILRAVSFDAHFRQFGTVEVVP